MNLFRVMADKIIDSLTYFAEQMVVLANLFAMILVFIFLVVTTPIWAIPYIIIRNRKESGDETEQ